MNEAINNNKTNKQERKQTPFPSSSPLPSSRLSMQYYYLQQTTAMPKINPIIIKYFLIINLLLLPLCAPQKTLLRAALMISFIL